MDTEIERLETMIADLRSSVGELCAHTARLKRLRNLVTVTEPSTGFGGRLRQRRLAAGYSLRELAALTGLSYQSIQAYERNLWTPRPATLQRMAKTLGVTVDELLSEESEQTEGD